MRPGLLLGQSSALLLVTAEVTVQAPHVKRSFFRSPLSKLVCGDSDMDSWRLHPRTSRWGLASVCPPCFRARSSEDTDRGSSRGGSPSG